MIKFFLFLTDITPLFAIYAGNNRLFYYIVSKYDTCNICAHTLHRVCETIRLEYPNIDNMISYVKKVLSKAPSRALKFRAGLIICCFHSIYLPDGELD